MPSLPPLRVAELADAFLHADYRWERAGNWHWFHVGETVPGVDAMYPEGRQFALISAWNPHAVTRDTEENRSQDRMLHRLLSESGFVSGPAFSSAPDRSWREPSWLVVDLPLELLDRLARHFGQLGTLAWERGKPVRLRMDAAAPAECAGLDRIDWLK